jgi:calnexin
LQGSFVLSKDAEYPTQNVTVSAPRAGGTDQGLVLEEAARKYAVTAPFSSPITAENGLVLQYEVRLQEGLSCGGAYIKLLNVTDKFDAAKVNNNSPYVIMFGPDRCGTTDKVHFIIRWKNPVTGVIQEKHLKSPPKTKSDTSAHVYTLIIRPDDTYAIKIDNEVEKEGSLNSDDFSPAILEPKNIDDPSDVKPAEWVDVAKIADPSATKPEDWDEDAPAIIEDADAVKPAGWLDDEPDVVPDPDAEKPEGWDDDEDGEYEAPLVPNPKCDSAPGCGPWKRPTKKNPAYKGKWSAPLIANPAYIGEWKPRQIENAGYFEDSQLHRLSGAAIAGVAVEVWTMNGGILFDNFLITTSESDAATFAEQTWRAKFTSEAEQQKAATRAASKKARTDAFQNGGFMDKIGFYIAEAWDVINDNPVPAIVTGVIILISTFVGFWYLCQGGPEEEVESRSHSRDHGHSHDHHGHSHDHETEAGESDGEVVDARLRPTGKTAAPEAPQSSKSTKSEPAAPKSEEAAEAPRSSKGIKKEEVIEAPRSSKSAAPEAAAEEAPAEPSSAGKARRRRGGGEA